MIFEAADSMIYGSLNKRELFNGESKDKQLPLLFLCLQESGTVPSPTAI